jgi:hypothetical protein
MNLIQNTNGPYTVPLENNVTREVTWNSSISNSNPELYIGAATGGGYSYQYLYWFLARAAPPNGIMPLVQGPYSVLSFDHLVAINSQSSATSNPFQLSVDFNASAYQSVESPGLTNVEFMLGNGTVLPSWLESGNSSSTNAVFWLRVPQIGADSGLGFYVVFLNRSSVMNGVTIGESPLLSSVYGQFDNGALIFNWYENFAGNTRPPGFGQWSYASVNDKLSITPPGSAQLTGIGVGTNATFGQYTTTDIYGKPLYANYNSYSAMQFGYNARSLQIGAPSGSSGVYFPWDVTLTNYPDTLNVWSIMRNGTEAWSMLNYGDTYSTTSASSASYSLGNSGQGYAYPSVVYWWRVRYSPPNGVMPSIYPHDSLTFDASGEAGTWSVTVSPSIPPSTQSTAGSSLTFYSSGSIKYTVTPPSGQTASPSGGSLTLGSSPVTVDITFTTPPGPDSATFHESGLPTGAVWVVDMGGKQGQANAPSSISISGANGLTYDIPQVDVRQSNGDIYEYDASPSAGTATNGGSVSTTFSLYAICTSGKCIIQSVNWSTPILLANWSYEEAYQVTPGTQIMAYNLSSGTFTNATVAVVAIDTQSQMLTINGGLQLSCNQSILTSSGWNTAGNLTIGSKVLNPYTGHYITVNSISLQTGSFVMYDFELAGGGAQSYIAWWYVLYAW